MDKSIKCFTLMRKNSKLEYVREIDGHYRNGQPIYATACISESNFLMIILFLYTVVMDT
jgi:hypothetical protein